MAATTETIISIQPNGQVMSVINEHFLYSVEKKFNKEKSSEIKLSENGTVEALLCNCIDSGENFRSQIWVEINL